MEQFDYLGADDAARTDGGEWLGLSSDGVAMRRGRRAGVPRGVARLGEVAADDNVNTAALAEVVILPTG